MYIVLWICASISGVGCLKSSLLISEFEWKYFDYDWESELKKNAYVLNGDYDYKNNIPVDADRSEDGRTFVTIKAGSGVPATLNTLSEKVGPSGPLLYPYPDWSWHVKNDCDVITSVYHIAIDSCNRLWVLDSGKISGEYVCPAQLLHFNLRTDKFEFRKKIPPNAAEDKYGNGLLYNLIVATNGRLCNNTKVFMADARGYGLVVWDGLRLFRVEGKVFEPEEKYTRYSIAGEKFHLAYGVRGMALSPEIGADDERYLFFRPLASKSLYAANSNDLAKVENRKRMNYFGSIDILPSQASSLAFSSDGTLFYGLTKEIGIGCWNMYNPLKPNYLELVLIDKERLQFISGLKLIHNSRFLAEPQEELLILSNRLQKVYGSSLDYNEINFRILRLSVKALINGTNCDTYNKSDD